MMKLTKAQKITMAWLKNWSPIELKGIDIPEPTADEVKSLVIYLATDLREIMRGPHGDVFRDRVDSALKKEAEAFLAAHPEAARSTKVSRVATNLGGDVKTEEVSRG